MQDRFKFRVYDDGKMVYFGQLVNVGITSPLMQCTGLKDKNGKLIYEGDIVNYSCLPGYSDIYACTFNSGKFLIGGLLISNTHLKSEVIGNIYENPELLEVSDDH
jgi:hypothetical protein